MSVSRFASRHSQTGLCWVGAGLVIALLGRFPSTAQEQKTLEDCVAIALDHHPSLKSAQASVDAANQRVWQAVSGYLPSVIGSYDAERRKTSLNTATHTGTTIGRQPVTSNFFDTGVSFSQILFDFGQNLAAIRAAQASERSVQADWVTQRNGVVFNVKQSYFNVLAARRLLGVADETVEQTRKQLEEAEGRHDVGLAPRFDVTRAGVQLANAELNQLTARNAVSVALETLRNALGMDAPIDFALVDTLQTAVVTLDEETEVTTAYAQRPELLSVREQQAAAEQQIARLQRDYLPLVTGDGGYDWAGTYPLHDNWNIEARVSISLFNGGLTTAQVGEAKAALAKLQYDERTLSQSIALDVRKSVLDAQQAAERIGVAAKGAQQARENFEVAEARYQTGVGNIIEVTDARAELASADAESVKALYDYQIALATLERATGGARNG